jgi:PAS domain S-box-containing protein
MWTKAKHWLVAGVPIANPIERSQAPMLQIALMTVFALLVLISPVILDQPTVAQQIADVLSLGLVLLGIALSVLVLRHAHFQAAIALFSTTFLIYIGSRLIVLGIARNPVLIVALLVPVVLAGLLARRRTLFALAGLSVLLLGIGLWVLHAAGTAPPTFEYRRTLTTYTAIVALMVVILERFGVSLRKALLAALDREQEHVQLQAALEALAAERQQAADTLRHLSDGLETRVLERTAQLTSVNEELAREISAREQAETTFRALLEGAPDAVVIINAQGIITLVNSQLEALFGYPRAHVIGQSVEVLVPERFRGQHAEHRAAYFTAPHVREMGAGRELYGLRQDGTEFPVEIRLSPVALSDGLLVKAAIRDITVRKQIEADLRESQERFAILFRNSPAGITLTRLSDGQYLDVNERFLGLVGFTRDEVIGRTAVDLGLLTAETRQQMAQLLHAQGAIHDLEVTIRIKDGDVRIFSASWEVVEVGNEACGLSILSDITERTQRQAALRASEDRFAKAFRSSPAALTITRLADSVFVDVNDSFLALFEYERDEVIGR